MSYFSITLVSIVVTLVALAVFRVLAKKPPEPVCCRAKDIDGCHDAPDGQCARGLCMVHCVCWCRGIHE